MNRKRQPAGLPAGMPDLDHVTSGPISKLPKGRANLPRQRGSMNKTEARYADRLQGKLLSREILAWWFEPIRLYLADRTYYSPDFMVITGGRVIQLHEVKGRAGSGPGGWEDDARVKIKTAAERYSCFEFLGASELNRNEWKIEHF